MDNKYVEMLDAKVSRQEIIRLYRHDTGSTAQDKTIMDSIVRQRRKNKAKELLTKQIVDKSPELEVHALTGMTVQRNGLTGEVIQFWTKTKPEWEDFSKIIQDFIKEIKPIQLPKIKLEEVVDTMLVLPFFDMHFGISDLTHYQNTLDKTLTLITSKKRKKIKLPIAQDLFHNNDLQGNTANQTPIEKVDMDKSWNDAMKFWRTIIEVAYQNCEELEIIYSRANHDESAGFFFVKALQEIYKDTDIVFDVKLDDVKARRFGNVMVAFSHGDVGKKKGAKTKDWYRMLSTYFPKMFLECKVREVLLGHLHHEIVFQDDFGLTIRRTSTGNLTDNWHYINGYIGNHKRFVVIEYSKTQTECIYYV